MQICTTHWKALRLAITSRGLGDLIASDGLTAAKNAEEQLKTGKVTARTFDPLAAAWSAITNNAIHVSGFETFALNPDGTDRCPICFLNVPEWIELAADGAKKYYDDEIKPK